VVLDLIIRRGQLVSGPADIGIRDGKVAQIGGEMSAGMELDATAKLVLPGGVDAHVHLSRPPEETREPAWVDDFTSGSAAALAGGITTVGNMTFARAGERPLEALARESAVAAQSAIADVFLHPVLGEPRQHCLDDIPSLLEHGCGSVKIFLSSPRFDAWVDGYVDAISRAGTAGLITMLHCEDAALLRQATQRLTQQGKTSLRYFADSRPVIAEVVATQRAVAIAEQTGAPVYVVHLSSKRALEVCAEARGRGVPVSVETRPLYLYLTSELLEREDRGRYIGQPPLREASDVAALWAGLSAGLIDTVCTDHAPWSLAAKLDQSLTIEHLRPGVENLQLLLPMLYSEGVRKGRLTLQRLIELTSSNGARLFGLYPRKGSLSVGSDADLVIFDPNLERTVTPNLLHSRADYSVYEGWRVTGWPVLTLRRGQIVFRDDQIIGRPGSGQVLACGPTQPL
jgi:dihydropyrimidinase